MFSHTRGFLLLYCLILRLEVKETMFGLIDSIDSKSKAMIATLCAVLACSIFLPNVSYAAKIEERPTAVTMLADATLRPIMLVGTLLGGGVYIATLPFSLLGGNAQEAGNTLVVQPFRATFLRCLGCTKKHVPDAEYY